MKVNKILLIIFTAALYVTHIPLYLLSFSLGFLDSVDLSFIDGKTFFGILIASEILLLSLCILITVFSIISVFKGENNPSKVTMICKLALIPWFVINFIICACAVMGMLNPFLLIGIIPAIILMVCTAYIFMLATSLPDIAHFIHCMIKRKTNVTALLVLSVCFMFIFCLDVAGAITYYTQVKDIDNNSL